jgi:hypothetical protein
MGTQPPQPVPALVQALNPFHVAQFFLGNRPADGPLRHPFAGADQGAVGQVHHAVAGRFRAAFAGAKHQFFRVGGQGQPVLAKLEHQVVARGFAHQDASQQPLAVFAHVDALVHALYGVFQHHRAVGHRRAERVAETSHVHADQLQLGRQIEARKHLAPAGEVGRHHVGHFVARRHQAVHYPPVQGALPDGVNVGVGGPQQVIDHDAAPRAHW